MPPSEPPGRQRLSVLGVVVLVAVVAVAGLAYGYVLGERDAASPRPPVTSVAPTAPPTVPVQPDTVFEERTVPFLRAARNHVVPEGATEWLNANMVLDLAAAPDGSMWAVGPGGVTQWPADGDTPQRRTTPAGEGPVGARSVSVAATGEVWVSTNVGLVRWNGEEWSEGMASTAEDSWALAAAADGSIWDATVQWQGGTPAVTLRRWHPADGDHVTTYDAPDHVSNLAAAPDGTVWANIGGRLWRHGSQGWEEPIAEARNVVAVTFAADGTVWLATDRLVQRWDGPATSLVVVEEFEAERWFVDIGAGPDGSVWAWSVMSPAEGITHELVRLDDGTRFAIPDEGLGTSLEVAADGSVWVGSQSGVYRLADGAWSQLVVPDDPPLQWPSSLAVGDDGTVWLGQDLTIVAWDGASWATHEAGDIGWGPRPGQEQADTPLWVTSRPGFPLYAGSGCRASIQRAEGWEPLTEPAELANVPWCWPTTRTMGADGSLWTIMATWTPEPELWRHDGSDWSWYSLTGVEQVFEAQLASGDDGALWATGRDVSRLEDGQWTTALGGVEAGPIAVNGGTVLVGERCPDCGAGAGGLWRFDGATWHRNPTLQDVDSVVLAPDGTGWVIGRTIRNTAGVWRYDGAGGLRIVVADAGLEMLALDVDGSAWAAAPGRLVHLRP